MVQNPARRHHVVSKFYLRGFADETKRVTRHPKAPGSPVLPIGIEDATVRRDFYRVEADDVESDAFEIAMGDLEGVIAPAFARLIAGGQAVSDDDRYLISSWVALHHLRSESTRRAGEEIYRAVNKLQVGVATTQQMRERLSLSADTPDERVEEVRARMLATVDTFTVDHHTHLQLIAEHIEGITNFVFFRHPWLVVRYQRKTLATSDTPVVLVASEEDRVMGSGTSIGTAAELFVPISRRVGLYMGDLPPLDHELVAPREQAGNSAFAKWSNQQTLWNARRVVYHHPADKPIDGLDNNGERLDEIVAPDTDRLIRGLAREQGRPSGLPDAQAS